MKITRLIMGMPITVHAIGAPQNTMERVFSYFQDVDERFSTYKPDSEISKLNRGELSPNELSPAMQEVLQLSEQTKRETNGYFDILQPSGSKDPSGLVKGLATSRAAGLLHSLGVEEYCVEAGGDMEVRAGSTKPFWTIGIQNPFQPSEIVKTVKLTAHGIATSGTYIRGRHIYNPLTKTDADSIASITVIGPDCYQADRFATAAFAMGENGIEFIERQKNLEGYLIRKNAVATYTSGFEKFL